MNAPIRRWILAWALLLASACSSGAKLAAAKFYYPTALAGFRGFTSKHPGEDVPRTYLAVANLMRDELTIIDPQDNQPVLSATFSFPLAVPTRPRPFRLAAAALEAPGDPDRGADLLVVATQSPPSLQLVTTWTEELRAQDLPVDDDLGAAFPGSAVLSLAAVSRPGGGAWVFVGLSGGHLAVLEFERDTSSTLAAARRPVRRSALALQKKDLATSAGRFDPLDLAVAPDASRLFVATSDPLHDAGGATVHGVGQLTVVGASAASAWPVVGLDARAPTRLVAAGALAQRTRASAVVFETAPVLQAFAVLDESACGADRPISCGVVTILPDVGIAPDPSGEQAYRAPIDLGAPISALGLVMPRRGGDSGAGVGVSWETPPVTPIDLMTVKTDAEVSYAQSALLIAATTGTAIHAIDPGRWSPVNSQLDAKATHRRLITSASSADVGAGEAKLGLYDDVVGGTSTVVDTNLTVQVRFTQGYLPADVFRLAWRGDLPGLSSRTGIVQMSGGQAAVAIQTSGIAAARIDAPELAVHVGDLVRVTPTAGPCSEDSFLATVTAVRPPDAAFPGGSLLISHAGSGLPGAPGAFPDDVACPDGADVVSSSAAGPVQARLTVRASGLVFTSTALGYLGRPELGVEFTLQHRDEAGLPAEELAVVRKLRRRFYPLDPPCGAVIPGSETGDPPAPIVEMCEDSTAVPPVLPPASPDPLTPGPMLRFRPGKVCDAIAPGTCTPGAAAALTFQTASGAQAKQWFPASRSVPTAIAWVDASTLDGVTADDTRSSTFFVAVASNEVVAVEPSTGNVTFIF